MATLHIAEFDRSNVETGNAAQVASCPPEVQQALAIGASSVPSAAFAVLTRFVRLKTDVGCHVAWGVAPVATSADMPLAAGDTEYFGVIPGIKLAVIASA